MRLEIDKKKQIFSIVQNESRIEIPLSQLITFLSTLEDFLHEEGSMFTRSEMEDKILGVFTYEGKYKKIISEEEDEI